MTAKLLTIGKTTQRMIFHGFQLRDLHDHMPYSLGNNHDLILLLLKGSKVAAENVE